MKVGDILIYIKKGDYSSQCFTINKHYPIYKIDNFIEKHNCGWIRDDNGQALYFKEEDVTNENWEYLTVIRKQKLKKICSSKD